MPNPFNFTNQFGEETEALMTDAQQQDMADAILPNTAVAALTALATDADLPTAVLKINAIIAALQSSA